MKYPHEEGKNMAGEVLDVLENDALTFTIKDKS